MNDTKTCGEVVLRHVNVDNIIGFVIARHILGGYTMEFGTILNELSYSKKCKILRSLKKPPKDINRDLERIGTIRNAIAHRLATVRGVNADDKERLVDFQRDRDFDLAANVEEFRACCDRAVSYLVTFISDQLVPADDC